MTRQNADLGTLQKMAVLPGPVGDDPITREQAALRRVATLVAHGAPPRDVFAAVAAEAGRLLGAGYATLARYGPADAITVVAAWTSTGTALPVGSQARLGGRNVPTLVFQTGRPARIDHVADTSGPIPDALRELGVPFRAAVGVPIRVEGGLWGIMTVRSTRGPLAVGTEARLAGFTELAATAIANAQARVELRGFAEEQAALRRVATLVARAAAPEEVFAAVTGEAGRLLHADHATMGRYGPDGAITVVATWGRTSSVAVPVGAQHELGGQDLHTTIFQTHRPARIDDLADSSGPAVELVRGLGFRAAVGVPVSAEGRLWGVMVVESLTEPLPAGTEPRLAGFTELAGTAIANAEAQAALGASRARIVTTADATRRRIERNLHDGAQQRLVSLALDLRTAQATATSGTGDLTEQLDQVAAGLDDVMDELREIAGGLHPGILTDSGLRAALKSLARRCTVPVSLDVRVSGRLPEPVETAAYYTVAEALTNTAKHAQATTADIQVVESDADLRLRIRDNGRGGADVSHGSGLVGLKDRAEALGGRLELRSLPGAGTTLDITLPLHGPAGSYRL